MRARRPELAARRRGRAGRLGRAGPGGRGRARARLRARRRPAGALPRRRGARLPVAARGLRDPGRRGDGLRDAGRRLVAPLAGRRGRARRPSAPIRGARRRSPRRSSARSPSASASSRSGSSTRAGSRGRPAARPCSRATSAHAPETLPRVRVGIDVSPLALTRAGTARYLTNLLAELERDPELELRRYSFGGAGPPDEARPRHGLVPLGPAAPRPARPRRTCSTARACARPSARRCRSSSRSTTWPSSASRAPSTAGRAATAGGRCPAWRGRRAGSSWAPSSPRGEVVELLRVPESKVRVVPYGVGRAVHGRRPGRRGPLRPLRLDARAAQEPAAARRGASSAPGSTATSCGSSARAAGAACASAASASAGSARWTTRSSRASTEARPAWPTSRSTRASACRCSRRWRAARRSSRPGGRPSPSSPTASPSRSTRSTPTRSRPGLREAVERRDELGALGPARAARYDWKRAAREHVRVYREAQL